MYCRGGIDETYDVHRARGTEDVIMAKTHVWAALLAASLLSSWFTVLLMGRGAPRLPPATRGTGVDARTFNARFDELIGALRPIAARESEVPDPARTSLRETEALAAIAGHLENLEALLGNRSWPQQPGGSAEVVAAGQRHPIPRWPALRELQRDVEVDREGTARTLFFMTPVAVLQRFGRPTEIYVSDNGSIQWMYDNRMSGAEEIDRSIVFQDGYVVAVW